MTDHFPLMVPGGKTASLPREVSAPYDGSLLATVDTADRGVAERALATAYALYRNRDAWLPPARRVDILRNVAKLMQDRTESLALEVAREGGKPLMDSRVEAARAIDGVLNCADLLRSEAGHVVPMNLNAASMGRIAFTQREPIVIVKPAEDTPLSCCRFVALLRECGLPEEWCQALVTENTAFSGQLVADRRVGFFSFIGSAAVGWMLRSQLAPGARCALEHGGAAPVLVAPDADLEAALPKLVKGGFYHAGQVCVSVQRVFAHRSIARDLAETLGQLAGKLRVGDPSLPETEVGPLIRHKEVLRVDQWVREALEGGAQLLCGGRALSESCYAPTVLLDPPADCKLSQLEVFGPVVCVYTYDALDEAIGRANALPVAFQAAIFTRDYATAMRAYTRLDASAVMLNDLQGKITADGWMRAGVPEGRSEHRLALQRRFPTVLKSAPVPEGRGDAAERRPE